MVRHATTPPGLILEGVSVSTGATTLYLSGQVAAPINGINPKGGSVSLTIADFGDTKTQTIGTLTKIQAILASRGMKMSDVVKLTVFVIGDPDWAARWILPA